jgi:hypothetical protein
MSDDAHLLVVDGVRFMRDLYDRFGFVDESFNLAQNFGVASDGRLVVVDIGELIDEESRIRELRRDRVWASDWCTMHFPEALRGTFIQEMDRVFGCRRDQDGPT